MGPNTVQFSTGNTILVVIALALLMTFRVVWASDQSAHESSKSLSLKEFVVSHGHSHPSSLNHLHVSTPEISDQDHLLLHALGAVEKHLPINLAAVPSSLRQDKPKLEKVPAPLPEQTYALYRPPKA